MEKLIPFIVHHWVLVVAFVIALVILIIVEARSKGMGSSGLSAQRLTQLINREQALVVDIRDAHAFNDGHIIHAINIPFAEIDQNLKRLEKDKTRPIVIVCAMGQKAAMAMNKLKKQGFEKVYILTGGMTAWKNAHMPVARQ